MAMMTSARHVSRWRLCVPPQGATNIETPCSSTSESLGTSSPSTPPVSLRYLNEFVGKLHCAPALLQHGLFPDAKEVTESMALFNAVRRYLLPKSNEGQALEKHDGIVVVGDGNTPRTAALFAFRMRQWKCYSVDPAMEKGTSERSKGWADVENLVVVRNKIENVRIVLRRAIVVLVHAHVTLEQALSAVQAEEVCGVVTLPCCNWYSRQEKLFGRGPDLVYDDFSVLSDHREIRFWVGDRASSDVNTSNTDLSLVSSVMKGCVRKEKVEIDQHQIVDHNSMEDMATKQVEDLRKRHDGVLDFIGDALSELSRDTSAMSREEYIAVEQAVVSTLPSDVSSHLETDTHVLVFDWHPRRLAVRLLLHAGYTNIYTVSLAEKPSFTIDGCAGRGIQHLKLQLYKCRVNFDAESANESGGNDEPIQLDPCGCFVLQSSFTLARIGQEVEEEEEEEEQITVAFENGETPAPPIASILDAGFLFRGFRGRTKKSPAYFRRVCRTLDQLVSACGHAGDKTSPSPTLVCLSPRKQWRKKEFLTHPKLGYDVQSLIAAKKQTSGTPVYVYCCFKKQGVRDFAAPAAKMVPHTSDESVISRDAALETWLELENMLFTRQKKLTGVIIVIDSSSSRIKAGEDEKKATADQNNTDGALKKVYVQASGEITRVRKFSNGMAFLSLELAGTGYDRPLQVFLERETLEWSPAMFAKVVSLLRKGDELVAVGFMARNARGHAMLQVEALSLARSGEYEAYN